MHIEASLPLRPRCHRRITERTNSRSLPLLRRNCISRRHGRGRARPLPARLPICRPNEKRSTAAAAAAAAVALRSFVRSISLSLPRLPSPFHLSTPTPPPLCHRSLLRQRRATRRCRCRRRRRRRLEMISISKDFLRTDEQSRVSARRGESRRGCSEDGEGAEGDGATDAARMQCWRNFGVGVSSSRCSPQSLARVSQLSFGASIF